MQQAIVRLGCHRGLGRTKHLSMDKTHHQSHVAKEQMTAKYLGRMGTAQVYHAKPRNEHATFACSTIGRWLFSSFSSSLFMEETSG